MNNYQINKLMDLKSRLSVYENKSGVFDSVPVDKSFNIIIEKINSQIHLYFSQTLEDGSAQKSGIMSRIDIHNPYEMLGIYQQIFTLALLLTNSPKQVCVLGSGGGRISLFLEFFFEDIQITNIEISKEVIELSKKYLGFEENKNQKIIHADAYNFVMKNNSSFDIIYLDVFGFDGYMPDQFIQVTFLEKIKSSLETNGCLVINIANENTLHDMLSENLKIIFSNIYSVEYDGVYVFFCSNTDKKMSALSTHESNTVTPYLYLTKYMNYIKKIK